MFTAALFITAKTWKQPKCPPKEEQAKSMWSVCIYIMEYYSAIKKNKIMPFAATGINQRFSGYHPTYFLDNLASTMAVQVLIL